jgi:hypothetical protein
MVHALEKVHGLLQPDGIVIDIHDIATPPRLAVHTGRQSIDVGRVLDHTDFRKLRKTDRALTRVVENKLLLIEDRCAFEYKTRADSLDALCAWLSRDEGTMYLPDATANLAEDLMSNSGEDAIILIHTSAWMTRLRPV